MSKLKVLSLFSGIGAFEKALERQNINYELVAFSEIDKYAITAYCTIHNVNEDKNLGDVSKINIKNIPDCDLITYGFPCQDVSVAGNQKGIIKGETRSGLLYEALRIIEGKKPKYAIAENVKNLVGKKFKNDFNGLLNYLNELGYNNYWQVLNAKDYGIPQNRERVFVVSIRKDIDNIDNGIFEFPKGFDNGLRLKDILEDKVEEKYYINNEKANKLLEELKNKELLSGKRFCADSTINDPRKRDISNCIIARYDAGIGNQKQTGLVVAEPCKIVCEQRTDEGLRFFKDNVCGALRTIDSCGDKRVIEKSEAPKPELVGGIGKINFGKQYRQGNRIYDAEKTAMCLLSQPVGNAGGNSYLYAVKEEQTPNELKLFTNLEGGKWDKIHESARRVYDSNGLSPTIPTCGGGNIEPKAYYNYRIRKLTPKECWRLMGFTDEDYRKARQALEDRFYNGRDRSNSQMYKMAGNSIVVNVLEEIFKILFYK